MEIFLRKHNIKKIYEIKGGIHVESKTLSSLLFGSLNVGQVFGDPFLQHLHIFFLDLKLTIILLIEKKIN